MFKLIYGLLALVAAVASSQATIDNGARTAGCGKPHTDKGSLRHVSIISDNVSREFLVYIPQDYDSHQSYPLQFSFHGNGKDMNYQAELTRFTDPTINPNMIAVFPNGLFGDTAKTQDERCWQGAPYCTSHNDLLFVTDLLEFMRNNYCIGSSHVYASGKSIGGGFVDLLACTASPGGDFAAFAMDAAAMYKEANDTDFVCRPSRRPIPILELHGTEDHTAPYNGGKSHNATLPNVRTVLNKWATRNGCGPSPVPTVDDIRFDETVFYTQYDCAGVTSVVVGYNVTGQGHVWISNEDNAENGNHTALIDASTIMMNFFNSNAKH